MESNRPNVIAVKTRAERSPVDWRFVIIALSLVSMVVALVSGTHTADWYYPLIIMGVALYLNLIPGKNGDSWKPLLVIGCILISMILVFFDLSLTDFGHEWTYPVAVSYLILYLT